MTDLLGLLALVGVPAALVTLIVLAALTVSRRRTGSHTPAPGYPVSAGLADPTARQAWATAYMAHARLTRLEQRVHALEARNAISGGDRR